MKRLLWLDIAKGLAILWVVYFHFFLTYRPGSPSPMFGKFHREGRRPEWLGERIRVDRDSRAGRLVRNLGMRLPRGRTVHHR